MAGNDLRRFLRGLFYLVGVIGISGDAVPIFADVDCSKFPGRGDCDSAVRECEWRRMDASQPGGASCENKRDYVFRSTLQPFLRVDETQFQATRAAQKAPTDCVGSLISDLAHEPCYALSTVELDQCACSGALDFSYRIPRQPDQHRLVLTPKLLLNHTMFMFIHVNKAAGETVKSIAYQALATNRWDGAGFGTRTGWQFLDKRRAPYAFPTWRRGNTEMKGSLLAWMFRGTLD
jgi:hypothetical protein